jgi:hypothetical protein
VSYFSANHAFGTVLYVLRVMHGQCTTERSNLA